MIVGVLEAAVLIAFASPALLLGLLGGASLLQRRIGEPLVARFTSTAMLCCIAALATALVLQLAGARAPEIWTARAWFSSHGGVFRFDFLLDAGSLSFALLCASICGIVARFSYRYLHLEPGFQRYFTLYAFFVLGILMIALAGSIEVLFTGWELIGLSSALLVGFFHDRPAPISNGLRVFAAYRLSDAALLAAAVFVHHRTGDGSLAGMFSIEGTGIPALSGRDATVVGALLIAAVAGKSALLPFSGWLPRAMEGPTPSSAVYYGSLSVHAGCYLLWRAYPMLEQSPTALVLAATLGLATAVFATLVARVQTDVKSALAFASLTQVGLIVFEIALGLRALAFVHMCGHACFRLLQFLTAPNVLHDLHELQTQTNGARDRRGLRSPGLHLFLLERGFLDAALDRWVVDPVLRAASFVERVDRALVGERAGRGQGAEAGTP